MLKWKSYLICYTFVILGISSFIFIPNTICSKSNNDYLTKLYLYHKNSKIVSINTVRKKQFNFTATKETVSEAIIIDNRVNLDMSLYSEVIQDYAKLIPIIKEQEGLMLKPYYCPGGYLTIGYGHLLNNNASVDKIIKQLNYQLSPQVAEYILLYDIDRNRKAICDLIEQTASQKSVSEKVLINLQNLINNKNQMLALTSFSYALGIGNLAKSTMWKNIKHGLPIDNEITKWCVLNGKRSPYLLKRRLQELQWYKSSN